MAFKQRIGLHTVRDDDQSRDVLASSANWSRLTAHVQVRFKTLDQKTTDGKKTASTLSL
jgi:hypothetical protein